MYKREKKTSKGRIWSRRNRKCGTNGKHNKVNVNG